MKEVVESLSAMSENDGEGEPEISEVIRFNAAGQMTEYRPNGEETVRSRGVWQSLANYAYRYDEQGRMVQAIVTEQGSDPIVYMLQYGNHGYYVPLLFPLGTFDFFLVKDLQSITTEDGSVSYTFDEEKVLAVTLSASWMGEVETRYVYPEGSVYPATKTVTTTRGGEVTGLETTTYSYGANGALATIDFREIQDGTEIQRMRINYADGQLLLPVSKKTDIGGGIYDWTYRYDAERRLIGIDYVENKGAEDELSATEEYDYIQTDSYGNWTQSVRQQQSAVDWAHEDGTFKVYRKIMY